MPLFLLPTQGQEENPGLYTEMANQKSGGYEHGDLLN